MIPARPVIRVATWNIRAAIGPGEPFPPGWWRHVDRSRLARIGAHLATLDADVVALQEVAVMTVDGDLLAQPAVLAEATGLVAHYGAVHHTSFAEPADGRVVGAGLWGNALLTRHEPDDRVALGLPIGADREAVDPPGSGHPWSGRTFAECEPGVREARCVVAGTIHYAGGPLRVLSTHLAYAGAEQRRAQAAAVVELAVA